jgi:hypothetical protein
MGESGCGFVISPIMVVVVRPSESAESSLPESGLHSAAVMTRRLLLVLLTAVFVFAACGEEEGSNLAPDAAPGSVPSLVGTYVVNGVDPLGTEYGGHLTITEGSGLNRYELQWIITGSIQEGTASLDGNELVADWETIDGFDRDAHGTAEYTVTEAGELYGTRTVVGSDESGTEEAFPND